MDTTGAVDLSLVVSEIAMPNPELLLSADLESWAQEYGFGMPPAVWARVQLTRLAAASVLEARLLHVKAARLGFFNLVADPDRVTLQQLACQRSPLLRHRPATAPPRRARGRAPR